MEYVSEAPYPPNEEINNMGEFKIINITKPEFEEIWGCYPNKYYDEDFIMKNKIQKLIQLGPIPPDQEISDELFNIYDDLLQTEEPLTPEEAGLIINFFSEDCDDLNWGLVHLIESVPLLTNGNIKEYETLIDQCGHNEFQEILRIRLENWKKKNI